MIDKKRKTVKRNLKTVRHENDKAIQAITKVFLEENLNTALISHTLKLLETLRQILQEDQAMVACIVKIGEMLLSGKLDTKKKIPGAKVITEHLLKKRGE